MSYNMAASNNKDGWMTAGRRQAPSAFGSPRSGERAPAPQAFMSSRAGPREAPAAFGGQTRTWKQDDAPSAFGGGGGRREAPAAFGGGAAGDDRRRRLEEKAAEARYRAEQALEERRKAAEAAASAKKAMDMNDEESYPTLGAAPAKKKATASAVSVVIDGTGTATAAAAPAAPKSKWGSAAVKASDSTYRADGRDALPAPAANQWAPIAEPEVKPLSMAQRIAAASARVDEEEAIRQAMEHRNRVLNRPCLDYYTEHQRRLASLPRRTLDDGFDDDPAYRNDLDEDDGYYAEQSQPYTATEEGEDGEINADLVSNRRRGDKGVW
jgi:hypothetical protein